ADRRNEAEAFAKALLAQVEPFAAPLPCQEKKEGTVTCAVTVRDRVGRPVQGAHTSLDVEGGRLEGVTDVNGATNFPNVKVNTTVIATVTLEDGEHDPPQFRIEFDDTPAAARSQPTPVTQDAPCDLRLAAKGVDSDKPGPALWPDDVEIYQRIRQAMRLAAQLGPITYGLPLRVHTFCTSDQFQCSPDK